MIFQKKILELLNINKKCIWIKGSQEREIMPSLINSLGTFNVDRIFTWNRVTNIEEIKVDKNNLYTKSILKASNNKPINVPLVNFFKSYLQEKNEIVEEGSNCALILNDYDLYLDNADYIRIIKEISEINYSNYVPIIVVSDKYDPPAKISHLFDVINYENPTIEEIEELLSAYEQIREVPIDNKNVVAKKLFGFSKSEIIEMLDLSFFKYNCINLDILNDKKISLINNTDILEYKEANVSIDDIGGNDNFKRWYQETKYCFSDEALEFGIDKPKGYLALGVPGCSKTLMAEAIASDLNIPLLKLNMSKVLSKFVGESEKKIEQAQQLIESCAPCVLLIDEVEKVLGGYKSSNASDSGTLARVFGNILEMLNDNDKGIFTIMTSNNVQDLPPELTRAGRLDAIFYFSLPNEGERREIFKIHFNKRKYNISNELINYVSENTVGYTGAEIEQIVKASLKKAYVTKMKNNTEFKVTKDILIKSKEDVIPVSRSSKEKIYSLEVWSKDRALFASDKNNKSINLDLIDIDSF